MYKALFSNHGVNNSRQNATFLKQSLYTSLIVLLAWLVFPSASFAQETVNNQTIIDLQKAGMSKTIITSKINGSNCTFDISTNGLIALKKGGVPDDIISLIMDKANTPPPASNDQNNNSNNNNNSQGGETSLAPGLYYFDASQNQYLEIDAAALSNNKSGGLGESALRSVSPLFNAKIKESISGTEANLKVKNTKPLFVFVIDVDNGKSGPNVRSPNEFMLVKMKQGKNDRELVVGKANSIGSDQGIDDKQKVQFTYSKVQRGLYEVSPNATLLVGEYCFIYITPSDQGPSYNAYDFSIR